MTQGMFQDIIDFHEKFKVEPKPYEVQTHHDHNYRIGFMEEELNEYITARNNNNKPEMLDALVDLVYVALGTAYMYGWAFDEAWRRVHSANMEKIKVKSAADSKRGHANDVKKPPGWTAPDLTDLV